MPISIAGDVPFKTMPSSLGYREAKDCGFVTLSLILGLQADTSLLRAAIYFQNRIRRFAEQIGFPISKHPLLDNGLYLYPANTIHCSVIDDANGYPNLATALSTRLSDHKWKGIVADELLPFPVELRWFYGGDPSTNSFTLQLLVPKNVCEELEKRFGREGSKLTKYENCDFRCGRVNIARLSRIPGSEEFNANADAFVELFREFESDFAQRGVGPAFVDRLSVVKSDSWLSNSNPEQRAITVRPRLGGRPYSSLEFLRSLRLDGPPDWSANIDKYLYGELHADQDDTN